MCYSNNFHYYLGWGVLGVKTWFSFVPSGFLHIFSGCCTPGWAMNVQSDWKLIASNPVVHISNWPCINGWKLLSFNRSTGRMVGKHHDMKLRFFATDAGQAERHQLSTSHLVERLPSIGRELPGAWSGPAGRCIKNTKRACAKSMKPNVSIAAPQIKA